MTKTTQVWDLATRLFHWALVASVFYAWFSVEILEDMNQHFYAGYAVLSLLLFRLVWGFIGSYYSRIRRLFFPVSETINYAQQIFSRSKDKPTEQRYPGHNPLGSLAIILMFIILSVQTGLGLFSTDDYVFGPLAGLVSEQSRSLLTKLHHTNAYLIYAIISLHLLAVGFYLVWKKTNLILPMITGTKKTTCQASYSVRSSWLAAVVFGLCVAAVYWLSIAFIDQLPQDFYY